MSGLDVGKNTIRARQRNPGEFQQGSFRTITLDKSRGIKAIIGRLKGKTSTTTQSILFPKKNFTAAQARQWLKGHNMKTEEDLELQEAVWTAKFINDLPNSSFLYIEPGGANDSEGKTKPRSLRHFPYKDASGKIDLPHLRNALARIPQSSLSADVKKRVAAKARRLAKTAGINVSEEFLDTVNLKWSLNYPAIFETLIAFNDGTLMEDYPYGLMGMYGKKLARKLTQYSYNSTENCEYDDEGNPTSESNSSENETVSRYQYHDGQIVTVKSTRSSDGDTEWGYSDAGDEDEAEMTFGEDLDTEEDYAGSKIKALRQRKKMSRNGMASMMSMSAARLTEIEDGDEMDEEEMGEIAGALGMSKKRFKRFIAVQPEGTQTSGREENEHEEIEIEFSEDDSIEIETTEQEEAESAEENTEIELSEEARSEPQKLFESIGTYEIDGRKIKSHRLSGNIVLEEIRSDGTARFKVPLINIGETTANGNRYSRKCADGLVDDINKLHESQRDKPFSERSCLDIRIAPKVMEDLMEESFDMMPTHGPRISAAYGNPLTSKAGKIVGGFIDGNITWVVGETKRTQAGKDIAVLIEDGDVKGVSLVGIPKVYESNGQGPEKKGMDVDRLQFLGADFTDNPAMPFPNFAEKESYFEMIK